MPARGPADRRRLGMRRDVHAVAGPDDPVGGYAEPLPTVSAISPEIAITAHGPAYVTRAGARRAQWCRAPPGFATAPARFPSSGDDVPS
ncbi:hypothetical protein JCM4914_72360 [Streptomyces platensis subsp. malvinus]